MESAHTLVTKSSTETRTPQALTHGASAGSGDERQDNARLSQLETSGLYDDDIIGVSISRVQTQMRSPTTPASEKARVMDVSIDYFERVPTVHEHSEDDSSSHSDDADNVTPGTPYEEVRPPTSQDNHGVNVINSGESTAKSSTPLYRDAASHDPSPSSAKPTTDAQLEHSSGQGNDGYVDVSKTTVTSSTSTTESPFGQRIVPPAPVTSPEDGRYDGATEQQPDNRQPLSFSWVTKGLLNTSGNLRRRTLSGSSTTLLASLKRFLPDLPASQLGKSTEYLHPSRPGVTSQRNPHSGQITPTAVSTQDNPASDSKSNNTETHKGTKTPTQLDANIETSFSPTSSIPKVRRLRSNSEGSLYLSRQLTEAARYDDFNAFSHVTDMANSRFKAITDSFRDSNIRLPRLPAVRPSIKRRSSPETLAIKDSAEGEGARLAMAERQRHRQTDPAAPRTTLNNKDVEHDQHRAHPILARALTKAEGDLVILGGYRGSILRSAKPPHRQVWVPIKVGLNIRKVDLEVGLTREDEEAMEDTIIPDGILANIGPIDICKRLLRHLHKCPNTRSNKLRIHNWGYDWRLSPDLSSERLIKFLETLPSNRPGISPEKRGALVIAHSLGGLVTRYAVNKRPELFSGVVYAGTPQHCVNILGPLRNGDDVLLSSRVLTAQVNFTVRTSFALLPESGRCFIERDTNERIDIDFFDPKTWEEYRLSPCITAPLPAALKEGSDRRKSLLASIASGLPSLSWGNIMSDNNSAAGEASSERTHAGLEAQDMEGNAGGMVGPALTQSSQRLTIGTTVTLSREAAWQYLERTLAEVKAFKQNLRFIPSHQDNNLYPPHSLIFGKTVPTVFGAKVTNREAIKYSDAFDELAFAAGDGVVLASAAQLPDGYRCVKDGRIESDRGHVGLMGDLEGMGRCIEAVIDARRKGVGLGKQYARQGSRDD